jgi:hypothetical protein
MPLWEQGKGAVATQEWGPPALRIARAEHQRVVLSFTPVKDATSYRVRYRSAGGGVTTIDGILVTDYAVLGLRNGMPYSFSVAAVGAQGVTPFSNELNATPTAEMSWDSLAEAFSGSNPTRCSCPFWMVHGRETDEELRQFMEVVYRFGFEGVTLHPYDFQGFLEEGMWHRWRVIIDHARKLGLVVWQQDDKDYPSGYAAGKVVAKNGELARWEVTLPHRESHRGPSTISLNVNSVLPAQQRLVAVSAFGPENRVEDLTDLLSEGQLTWQVPGGDWKVFVVARWQPGLDNPSPRHPDVVRGEVRGYIDPLNSIATDRYIETIYEATARELSPAMGEIWKGWFIDEPAFYSTGSMPGEEGHGYPYTPDFLPRFEERYGYSLRPLLPLLWVEHGPRTTQVRHDYLEFVSREYNRLFFGKIAQFCEARGMQMIGHLIEDAPYQLGWGTGGNFRSLEHFSMGGFDHIFDQWYTPQEDVYWRQPKMASSVSHYKPTPLDEAMVEHFAATGWRTGLTEMKAMMDWTTCRGLNHIVPCGIDTQDPPVWEDAPEFWLHGANPLAPFFRAYQVIANRETMLIRGGRHVAKALILDTAESAWVGAAEELWRVDKAFSQAHFDYDNTSYGVFSDPDRCRIEGKRIRLAQEEYEFVVVPGVDAIPLNVVERLLEFYEAGGTVISVGPGQRVEADPGLTRLEYKLRLPFKSADGRHDSEVRDLVDRIWGERASQRGRAYLVSYKDVTDLLYSLDAHDVWIEPNLQWLQYYHRKLSGRDLYFFNNEGEPVHTMVQLRGAKGVPELWDLATGRILQAPCYGAEDSGVRLLLQLARYESVFVVLNPAARPEPHLMATDADEVRRAQDGRIVLRKYAPGSIQYTLARTDGKSEGKRLTTPSAALSPTTLDQKWERTATKPNGALYRAGFSWRVEASSAAMLEISGMTQVLRVKLNGQDLGTRFTYPFRFELGSALREGRNEIELEHVERHTFTSKLGRVRLIPYYEFRI